MTNMPLVSIVIPAYNYAHFLDECLQSALGQTYPNLEVIVVDDGSTDDTAEVVNRYPQVRYVAQRRNGNGGARAVNRGIREAQGAYIAWLSADDRFVPHKIARQLEILLEAQRQDPLVCMAHSDVFYEAADVAGLEHCPLPLEAQQRQLTEHGYVRWPGNIDHFPPHENLARAIQHNIVNGCTTLVDRRLFDEIGLLDDAMPRSGDVEMWTRMLAHGKRFVFVPEPLTITRFHVTNTSEWGEIPFEYNLTRRKLLERCPLERIFPHLRDAAPAAIQQAHLFLAQTMLQCGAFDAAEVQFLLAGLDDDDPHLQVVRSALPPVLSDLPPLQLDDARSTRLLVFFDDESDVARAHLVLSHFLQAFSAEDEVSLVVGIPARAERALETFTRRFEQVCSALGIDPEVQPHADVTVVVEPADGDEVSFLQQLASACHVFVPMATPADPFYFTYARRAKLAIAYEATIEGLQGIARMADPRAVDIVLLTHNRLEYLQKTVDALFEQTRHPFRLTIVDNASEADVREYLQANRRRFFHVVYNMDNRWTTGFNQGIALTRSDPFIVSDPDIVVPATDPCWLSQMLAMMAAHPEMGMLALNLDPSNKPEKLPDVYLSEKQPHGPDITLSAVGTCMQTIRRAYFEPPYLTDFLTVHGIRQRGGLVGFANNLLGYHLGWDEVRDYPEHLVKKYQYFTDRYGYAAYKLYTDDEQLLAAMDASVTRSISIIWPVLGNLETTRAFLQAADIGMGDQREACEVVLIDVGISTEEHEALYATLPGNVRVFRLVPGTPLSKAYNYGALHAGGKRLVFVEPGLLPTVGWLEALLAGITKADVVGATYFTGDGKLARGPFAIQRLSNNAISDSLVLPVPLFVGTTGETTPKDYPCQALAGGALMIEASHFEGIGGFDPQLVGLELWLDLTLRIQHTEGRVLSVRAARMVGMPLETIPLEASERSREHFQACWQVRIPATAPEPASGAPIVSIIIPLFNKVEFTQQCLESIAAQTPAGLFEVILVDNASTDGTRELLAQLEGDVTVITNQQNLGFAKACNQGAAASKGKYLLFLNNDTEAHPGWLEPLVQVLDQEPDVAAVGSKLLFPDGTLQHAGVEIVEEQGLGIPLCPNHRFYRKAGDLPEANQRADVQVVTAAAMLVRSDCFRTVGGFDESYWNGYEDVDLCFKIGERGWRIVYEPRSCLAHFESASGPERRVKENENLALMTKRWLGQVAPDFRRTPDGVKLLHPKRATASIIIVTYNSAATIAPCVESVLATMREGDEIILVDNASQDATPQILRDLAEQNSRVKIQLSPENLGFSAGTNLGIKHSQGHHIVLLNPDTHVFPGWLDQLIEGANLPSVGAVGPTSDYVAGLQKWQWHAPANLGHDSPIEDIAESLARVNRGRFVETKLLIGFCMLVPRAVLDQVGLLDEELFLGNDDLDLSWRLQLAGLRLLVATGAFVHHVGQVSFKTEPSERTQRLVQESTDALARKLVRHYGPGRVPLPQELWEISWFSPTPGILEGEGLAVLPDRRGFNVVVVGEDLEQLQACLESYLDAFQTEDDVALHILAGATLERAQELVLTELARRGLDPERIPDVSLLPLTESADDMPACLSQVDVVVAPVRQALGMRKQGIPVFTDPTVDLLKMAWRYRHSLDWSASGLAIDTQARERWLVSSQAWQPALEAFFATIDPRRRDIALLIRVPNGSAAEYELQIGDWLDCRGLDPTAIPDILLIDDQVPSEVAVFRSATAWIDDGSPFGRGLAEALGLPVIGATPEAMGSQHANREESRHTSLVLAVADQGGIRAVLQELSRAKLNWEAILVELDPSPPGAESLYASLPGYVQIVRATEPRSLGEAFNVGAKAATGCQLLFLEPGALPVNGSLEALSAELDRADLVSGSLVDAAGKLLRGAYVFRQTGNDVLPVPLYAGLNIEDPLLVPQQDCQAAAGGAVIVRTDWFSAVEGFEPELDGEYLWLDFSLRIHQQGGRIVATTHARFMADRLLPLDPIAAYVVDERFQERWSHDVRDDAFTRYVADGLRIAGIPSEGGGLGGLALIGTPLANPLAAAGLESPWPPELLEQAGAQFALPSVDGGRRWLLGRSHVDHANDPTLRYEVEINPTSSNTSHGLLFQMIEAGSRVLELGCAGGHMTRHLVAKGCQVVGVELDPLAAEHANQFADRVLVGDVEALDLAGTLEHGSFDVILAGDVLEHLKDPQTFLQTLQPLLKPDGVLIGSVPNVAHGSLRLGLLAGQWRYRRLGLLDRTHIRFFTRWSLREMLRRAGYQPLDLTATTAPIDAVEIRVPSCMIPTEVKAALQQDPEAQAYQFVFRASATPRKAVQGVAYQSRTGVL